MAPSRRTRTPARPLAALSAFVIVAGSVVGAAPAMALPGDTEPPVVSITSPADGHVFTSSGGEVLFSASDPSGVEGYSLAINGHLHGGGTDNSADLPIGQLENGAHTFTLTVTDREGNSYVETRGFEVARTTIDMRITSPTHNMWLRPNTPIAVTFRAGDYVFEEISVDGVARPRAAFATAFKTTTLTTGPMWTDGSVHTYTVVGYDHLGRSGSASVDVRIDAAAPTVAITASALPEVVSRSTIIRGTAGDTASGVRDVQLRAYANTSCTGGSTALPVTLTGDSWTASVGTLADGTYCLRATAADGAGYTASTSPVLVAVDTTPPAVPAGLSPDGPRVEPVTELSWTAVPGAASYEYRTASDSASLVSTYPTTTSLTRVPIGPVETGSIHWQVRAVDEHGNASEWSAVAEARVVAAPLLDDCASICHIVAGAVPVGWSAVSDAIAYHVRVTGTDADGVPVVFDEEVDADLLETILTLPTDFPTGTISVRVRAEIDGDGSLLTEWSEPQRFLRFSAPSQPELLKPAHGAYVAGDEVALEWSDDPSVMLWEVRVSSTSTLDEDGGLELGEEIPLVLMDPVFLAAMLVAEAGEVPEGIRLDEFDALADCATLLAYLEDELEGSEFLPPCADGGLVIPETVADGDYFWQVRGLGFDALTAMGSPGPWSAVGSFTVGEPPVVVPPGGGAGGETGGGAGGVTGAGSGTGAGTSTNGAAPLEPGAGPTAEPTEAPVEEPVDVPTEEAEEPGGNDVSGGSSDDGAEAAVADDGGFPLAWVVGGVIALVVLGGGGALAMVLLRRP